MLSYAPRFSVAWNGVGLIYYEHKPKNPPLTLKAAAKLLPEWLLFWSFFWAVNFWKIPLVILKKLKRRIFRKG
jgi:hypothetical protein